MESVIASDLTVQAMAISCGLYLVGKDPDAVLCAESQKKMHFKHSSARHKRRTCTVNSVGLFRERLDKFFSKPRGRLKGQAGSAKVAREVNHAFAAMATPRFVGSCQLLSQNGKICFRGHLKTVRHLASK